MALRVGCDLDGVLADMDAELLRVAETLFGDGVRRQQRDPASADEAAGSDPPVEPPPEAAPSLGRLQLTPRQQSKLWRHVQAIENFWETLAELEPGAIARLAGVAEARRWEIIFLTKRPQTVGATAQVQSQRWLQVKGYPLPSVYVVQGSRGRIADSLDLDVVVDDRPENCLDVVADSKARAMLVWRGDESALPASTRTVGIGVVKSVGECLDVLTKVDVSAPEQSGLMTRVMRALGLKEPAQQP
jgi:hypothetical protein